MGNRWWGEEDWAEPMFSDSDVRKKKAGLRVFESDLETTAAVSQQQAADVSSNALGGEVASKPATTPVKSFLPYQFKIGPKHAQPKASRVRADQAPVRAVEVQHSLPATEPTEKPDKLGEHLSKRLWFAAGVKGPNAPHVDDVAGMRRAFATLKVLQDGIEQWRRATPESEQSLAAAERRVHELEEEARRSYVEPQRDAGGAEVLPNGRRLLLTMGGLSPGGKLPKVVPPQPTSTPEIGPISGGLSGSTSNPMQVPQPQSPQPKPEVSQDEEEERERARDIHTPFLLGIGKDMTEAEREGYHRQFQQLIEKRSQSIEALKAANRGLDPLSDAHAANNMVRWREEQRQLGLERQMKVLEQQLANDHPGTRLPDELFQKHNPHGRTREQQQRVDERAKGREEFRKYLIATGQSPNLADALLGEAAGKIKHGAAGLAEWMGWDASELREDADDNLMYAGLKEGFGGMIARGLGGFVGTVANPSGKWGLVLGALRGAASSYSEALSETGDREAAKQALLEEAPWLAVYMVTGKVGAKAGQFLLPKNTRPLLQRIATAGGEELATISVDTARTIAEQGEWSIEQLSADTLLALVQRVGEFRRGTSLRAMENAKRELLARGYGPEQMHTPVDAGVQAMLLVPAHGKRGSTKQDEEIAKIIAENAKRGIRVSGRAAGKAAIEPRGEMDDLAARFERGDVSDSWAELALSERAQGDVMAISGADLRGKKHVVSLPELRKAADKRITADEIRALPEIMKGDGVSVATQYKEGQPTRITSVRYHNKMFYVMDESLNSNGELVITSLTKVDAKSEAVSRADIRMRDARRLMTQWNIARIRPGDHLRSRIGDPRDDMYDPHAHHILFKKGLGEEQHDLVLEGQDILWRNNIDPIYGVENFVWAPNGVAGQHSIETLKKLVDALKAAEGKGGNPVRARAKVVKALRRHGEEASQR